MSFVVVQRGTWQGVEADVLLDSRAAAAFLTAAHDYMAETHRPMPEIVEPLGGLRLVAQTTEMRWAFDYGPHGIFAKTATAAQRAQSDAIYAKYNMSRVSTARPAITGTHTTGLYFDVATAAFLAWLLVNGHRYGITRPLLNDPNHCQVTPGTETVALNVTALDNTPAPQQKESDMELVYIQNAHAGQGDYALITSDGVIRGDSSWALHWSEPMQLDATKLKPVTEDIIAACIADLAKLKGAPVAGWTPTAAQLAAIGQAVPVPSAADVAVELAKRLGNG